MSDVHLLFLAFVCPPLTVWLKVGNAFNFWLNLTLYIAFLFLVIFLLFPFPFILVFLHALWVIVRF